MRAVSVDSKEAFTGQESFSLFNPEMKRPLQYPMGVNFSINQQQAITKLSLESVSNLVSFQVESYRDPPPPQESCSCDWSLPALTSQGPEEHVSQHLLDRDWSISH